MAVRARWKPAPVHGHGAKRLPLIATCLRRQGRERGGGLEPRRDQLRAAGGVDPRREPGGRPRPRPARAPGRAPRPRLRSSPVSGRASADEAWQFHRYLTEHRLAPYDHAVTFNSNGIDENRISTGAKDDMDMETVREVAAIARRLGVETFILDDGWQARSGDWQPDSPQYPEPRWDGVPGSKFAPRFPDSEFRAVREAIAPMRLGLWMSPTAFNPSSQAFQSHPEWACAPLGDGLAAYNVADRRQQLQRGRDRAMGPRRPAPRRGAHPRRDRELGRRLLEVRLPPVARLRGARRRARPLRVPRRVRRDARPPAGRPPRRDLRDRRDERLPPLPLRVGLARTDLVPERRAEPRPDAAQPVEPEPLRAGVRARPGGARQPGLRAATRSTR